MTHSKLEEIKKNRLNKVKKLKQLNIDPYPQPDLSQKDTCSNALNLLNKSVVLAGRLMSIRGHGKIMFADLEDYTGKIQLFFQQDVLGKEQMKHFSSFIDLGDIVSVSGKIFKTKAGQITVDVSEFQLLSKAIRPLPEKWHGLKDTEERYRQRYLDLIVNPQVRQVFLTRTKILSQLRAFLDKSGFLEVETPILQTVYGGASAKPFVTHHNTLDMDMYLRISNELFLKRLIVGGFEKVYEVSKDFRNEGVSRFHNPEFTQVEFYWAYVDYEVLMNFTQDLLVDIIKAVKGNLLVSFQGTDLDFSPPFKRVTFRDAILKETAIDIDKVKTKKDLIKQLTSKKIKIDLDGVVGLGAALDQVYKEHVRPNIIKPTYITDYPFEMIALAKRKANNPQKIASFQLLVCGTELLKAYDELNDPVDQSNRWLKEANLKELGLKTAMQFDHDYIRALEYGMPPTAGWGMGIDRLTQFLTDQPAIKDVILFPSMRQELFDVKKNQNYFLIGQIDKLLDHPNADKLHIATVNVGTNSLQIVCGADNISVGDLVPVALPGAKVLDDDGSLFRVKARVIRGVDSQAMMCSQTELGVGQDRTGIKLLDKDNQDKIGQILTSVLDFSSKLCDK
jgi:lysyl-tRNA synthetase, class II